MIISFFHNRYFSRLFVLSFMATSEIDQTFLGVYATATRHDYNELSRVLYKVLGLSIMLSASLKSVRRLRSRQSTNRNKFSRLYERILWLSHEGLILVQQYVIPMVQHYLELWVLAHKMQATFFHIFVLLHDRPLFTERIISQRSNDDTAHTGAFGTKEDFVSASLIPSTVDFTPIATESFKQVNFLCEKYLPWFHPIRLSTTLSFATYAYECLQDGEACKLIAKKAIEESYHSVDKMNVESWERSSRLIQILRKMIYIIEASEEQKD